MGQACEAGHLVVHVHGGLVDRAAGEGIATRLDPRYRATGAIPLFPVWESGLLETVRNNLGAVAKEALFRVLVDRLQDLVLRKFGQDDGTRAAGSLPPIDTSVHREQWRKALQENDASQLPAEPAPGPGLTELQELEERALEQELATDLELLQVTAEVANALRPAEEVAADQATRSAAAPVRRSAATLMDPDALEELLEEDVTGTRSVVTAWKVAKAIAKVGARVLRRYLAGRDHGLHATIVEETLRAFYLGNIGGLLWKTMKGDTADHFGGDPQVHGGTAILEALAHRLDAGDRPRVTLVGHSAGSVFLGHFLAASEARLGDRLSFDVALLAPAATFDLAAATYARHRSRITGLRMFTMTDANERADRLVPVLYPHSLLYFISGVLEPQADEPLLGMQRFFDSEAFPAVSFPTLAEGKAMLDTFPHAHVWSVAQQGAGRSSSAVSHGGFDDDPDTLESLEHLLKEGFGA